jgi:hypothetical protein
VATDVEEKKMISEERKILKEAFRKAFMLGQVYWQQADSDYASQWKKADATRLEFEALLEETLKTNET